MNIAMAKVTVYLFNRCKMNTELMNEFYMLQQSRSNAKYLDILEDTIYSPIQEANHKVTSWMYKRGNMLMKLEHKAQLRLNKIKRKFLK
jgi:hypothetical protein